VLDKTLEGFALLLLKMDWACVLRWRSCIRVLSKGLNGSPASILSFSDLYVIEEDSVKRVGDRVGGKDVGGGGGGGRGCCCATCSCWTGLATLQMCKLMKFKHVCVLNTHDRYDPLSAALSFNSTCFQLRGNTHIVLAGTAVLIAR
jgi:hypothetical protein